MIYRRNVASCGATIANFIRKYKGYLYESEPEQIAKVDATMVWDNFQAIVHSAAGMGGWEPLELKLFSFQLCMWTAALYQLIEEGAPWPVSTRHAKIAYLEKQGSMPGEVMSYLDHYVTAIQDVGVP